MCSPHCWQYAKPSGVGVPQRGHVIELPIARTLGGVTVLGGSVASIGSLCGLPPPNGPGGPGGDASGPDGIIIGDPCGPGGGPPGGGP